MDREPTTIRHVAAKKKGTWGGKRSRAGRKPELDNPVRYTLDLEGPQMDRLEMIAQERGASVASVVREAVAEYLSKRGRR